jgi:hypothetical protein
MKEIPVQALCTVCLARGINSGISAFAEVIIPEFTIHTPICHEGRPNHYEITFACSNVDCAVTFRHPPGMPNAKQEIYDELQRQDEQERHARFHPVLSNESKAQLEEVVRSVAAELEQQKNNPT